jgi:hypothetical protein
MKKQQDENVYWEGMNEERREGRRKEREGIECKCKKAN